MENKAFKMTAFNRRLGNLVKEAALPERAASWDEQQIRQCMYANLDKMSADSKASRELHERQLAEADRVTIEQVVASSS